MQSSAQKCAQIFSRFGKEHTTLMSTSGMKDEDIQAAMKKFPEGLASDVEERLKPNMQVIQQSNCVLRGAMPVKGPTVGPVRQLSCCLLLTMHSQ